MRRRSSARPRKVWSWESADDLSVGPGAYDIPQLFGVNSVQYPNAPSPVISRGNKQAPHRESGPGVSNYQPNYFTNKPSSVSPVVGTEKQERLPFFQHMAKRSPGPIYNLQPPARPSTGGSISRAPRELHPRRESPSPGEYNVQLQKSSSAASFKGAYNPGKQYLPNYSRFLKGADTPGPADYHVQQKSHANLYVSRVGRNTRSRKGYIGTSFTPGPGEYAMPRAKASIAASFTTQKRVIDVKKCKIHAVASNEGILRRRLF